LDQISATNCKPRENIREWEQGLESGGKRGVTHFKLKRKLGVGQTMAIPRSPCRVGDGEESGEKRKGEKSEGGQDLFRTTNS